jgi:hypothetical protein
MAMNHRRIGIRSTADAGLFLISDWVNLSGMNNCLMYGVGCWAANSAGGANASPYNTFISYNDTDTITGGSVSTAASSAFQANGEVAASTTKSPSRGYVFVMYGNADGASAQRVFQASGVTENTQTWKSYIAHNAMWVGDTPTKRMFFNNNGLATAQSLELTTMGSIALPSVPNSPNIVGTNFATTYTETVSQSQPPV